MGVACITGGIHYDQGGILVSKGRSVFEGGMLGGGAEDFFQKLALKKPVMEENPNALTHNFLICHLPERERERVICN